MDLNQIFSSIDENDKESLFTSQDRLTPLEYKTISDNPKDGEEYAGRWLMSGCILMIAIIPLICLILSLILSWIKVFWISTIALFVLFMAVLALRFKYDKTSPRLRKAERVKKFLGFDFGNNFILKARELREHDELKFFFDENSFAPLSEFCKSQKEYIKNFDNVVTDVKQHSIYFTKTEKHCNFSISCVVEYDNRILIFSILSCP